MKIRIKGNSLRLRLSQTEVANFNKRGFCEDSISFGDNKIVYRLQRSDIDHVKARYAQGLISIGVPVELGKKWATEETMVGFEHYQDIGNDEQLFILIEKDFACLTSRPNEDESDNFPNPLAADGGTC